MARSIVKIARKQKENKGILIKDVWHTCVSLV